MRGDTRDRKQPKAGQPDAVRRPRSEDAKAAKTHAAHSLDQRAHIQQTRVADGEGIEKPSGRGKPQKKRPAAPKKGAAARKARKRSK
jgi:hypothetical protein